MISGKNTNHLGVEQMPGSTLRGLQVTNLERTLIDIVVRPAYAGGISKVIAAYRTAKDRASVDQLLSILDKLNYVYPYHQAIGFLMEKVGFPKKNLERLQSLGLQHDFYLVHGMHQPKYSREWRLFFPADIRA